MKIIQSTLLNMQSNIIHGFTTKDVGNLAFHVNDNPDNVEHNHSMLAKELHYDKNSLIHMKQIHSADVHTVNVHDNFTNPQSCDALITNQKHIPLMVMIADCSPILFYDYVNKVIAVAHAGRQGAFKNIVQKTIDSMKNEFGSSAQNIFASVGASIGSCCYEVGEEIYKEAKELNLEYFLAKKENSYYLDIKTIIQTQLLNAGIQKVRLEISNECTCCSSKKYYSYRANPQAGRCAGVIMLK